MWSICFEEKYVEMIFMAHQLRFGLIYCMKLLSFCVPPCELATFCPTVYLAMMTDHIFYSRISTGNTIRITVSFFLVFLQRNYYHERHGLMHAQNKNDQDRSHRPLTALTISLAVLRIFNTRSSGQALSE